MDKQPIQKLDLRDIPLFQRLEQANPDNPNIDAISAANMFGQAIHWASIFEVIWPDFDNLDYYGIDVTYIARNDPDKDYLPESFYVHTAQMIAMFWELQLQQKYPAGDWTVDIDDEPEMTVRAEIRSRG